MKLADLYREGRPAISFELFPPKTDKGLTALENRLGALVALQPDFMTLFWSYFRTPERSRNPGAIDAALQSCDRHFQLLDAHLESHPFLAGSEFTLADIPAGTSLHRYFEMGVEVPRHHHVAEWYARLSERSAYKEHVMVSFEELRGRLEF